MDGINIEAIEKEMVPRGNVVLVGTGRLGLRMGLNLIHVHRGGPEVITAIDGQKISGSDVIFHHFGGSTGQYKVDLLQKLSTHSTDFRRVVPLREDITMDNLDLVNGDVVSVQMAGGNTIPITAEIIKKAQADGAKTVSTAGIFGMDEKVSAMDISKASEENPVVAELRDHGIHKNHTIVTTGKFIRDKLPVTPYILDDVAKACTNEILKALMH
jgi:predicted ThiF/HesA family dinucleotide-utilizing enzyme